MLPILGRPMLELMVERLRRARTIDDVVIATTVDASCDPIIEMAGRIGVPTFRGSEDDVLLRVLEAAKANKADVIVETTGDCPLHEPSLVDKVVADFHMGGSGFVSNIQPYSTPIGTDVRVFTTAALDEVNRISQDAADHEHVSLYFMERPERYRSRNVVTDFGVDVSRFRLTVDTAEDFELVSRIYEELYPKNPTFTLHDVLTLLRSCPDLVAINAAVKQKAVR
jgi:spore coat polysaccharide biosynthesis protein SpsF